MRKKFLRRDITTSVITYKKRGREKSVYMLISIQNLEVNVSKTYGIH